MRAITWQGRHKVQVDTVPDPEGIYRYHVRVIDPRDRVSDSPAVAEATEEI